MKKFGIIILALALLCTCLAGCGDGNVDKGDDGYIGDNTHDNNNGNVPDNGNGSNNGGGDLKDDVEDILDPDNGGNNGDNGSKPVPTANPSSSPAVSTQPVTP